MISSKVNLGFLIIQHTAKVFTSSRSIFPYGLLLTTIFQHFEVDLDSESDVRMSKPSDYVDNACITRLGYEHNGCKWHAPAAVHLESTDEEAEMDVPPPSPTAPPSPPPASTTATGSSSAPPDWY